MPAVEAGPSSDTAGSGYRYESPHGRFLYYAKRAARHLYLARARGAWRGDAVVDSFSFATNFVVAHRRIYFVAVRQSP